jgi:hypothetical protein
VHLLVSYNPERAMLGPPPRPFARLARFATLAEAKAAVDDPPEVTASWARGRLDWYPAWDDAPRWLPAVPWYQSGSKTWMRPHRGTLLTVTHWRSGWVVFVVPYNPSPGRRKRCQLGVFTDRDQAFAAADDYILGLS